MDGGREGRDGRREGWFAYQAVHWIVSVIMSAGDFFLRQIEKRREADAEKRREAAEQARRLVEYQKAHQKAYDEYLMRNYGLTKEQIQQAHQLSGPFPPSMM